ncbi:hypothetical protein BAU15_03015 [Enterococcus sp. JM4C]|uniref:hypothetical protein n=1 Tax=Candidatus Enterococcus huntleyi TaxID=1857217 RepID=UPI0013797BBA|nr:hypothetical protein [Enterococcus sp. JM4C]KAF1295529.1 hypothetical protein BAU15_03015 [Enterococcus sp. JM4C]
MCPFIKKQNQKIIRLYFIHPLIQITNIKNNIYCYFKIVLIESCDSSHGSFFNVLLSGEALRESIHKQVAYLFCLVYVTVSTRDESIKIELADWLERKESTPMIFWSLEKAWAKSYWNRKLKKDDKKASASELTD